MSFALILHLDLLANLNAIGAAEEFPDEFSDARAKSYRRWPMLVSYLACGKHTDAFRLSEFINSNSKLDLRRHCAIHRAAAWLAKCTIEDTIRANHWECLKVPFAKSGEVLSSAKGISFLLPEG